MWRPFKKFCYATIWSQMSAAPSASEICVRVYTFVFQMTVMTVDDRERETCIIHQTARIELHKRCPVCVTKSLPKTGILITGINNTSFICFFFSEQAFTFSYIILHEIQTQIMLLRLFSHCLSWIQLEPLVNYSCSGSWKQLVFDECNHSNHGSVCAQAVWAKNFFFYSL